MGSENAERVGMVAARNARDIVVKHFPIMALAELHLHLEGSLEPETLAEIDPALTVEEVRAQYRFETFAGFLEAYKWAVRKLHTPRDFAIAARALRHKLAGDGVTHSEWNLSVGVMLWRQQDARAIVDAIVAEAPGVPLIFDGVRNHPPEFAVRTAELAAEYGVAFGIGGDEAARPLADFRDAIRLAEGRFLPHAGETSDARAVWDAVEFGARRIGHGIRAIDDPVLCRRLRDDGIPLEVSITSNVATGAVPSLEAHPVRRLFDLGVPITLNTDDPAIFRTSLPREYELARHVFGFSDTEIQLLQETALHHLRRSSES